VVVTSSPFRLDVNIDGIGDPLIGSPGLMLVDHRGPLTVMTHTDHQVPKTGAAMCLGRDVIPGVAKIMEVQAGQTNRRHYLRPS
jgi:hypothetical protein